MKRSPELIEKNLDELIPYVNNSRTHSDEQIAQVAASIKEFGFTNPILIDDEGGIIAGHGRTQAARRLGMESVPCIVLEGLTEAQKKAYVIADNQLALNAGWNVDLLKLEIKNLDDLDFDLDLLGFEPAQLDIFLTDEPAEGLTDDNAVPDVQAEPVTVEGDVWILGNHRVMAGDSTNLEHIQTLSQGEVAALLHADPPYGMGKEGDGVANDNLYREKLDQFQIDWYAVFRTLLEPNASVYIWGNAPDLWRLWFTKLEQTEPLTFRNEIIWNKRHGMGIGAASHRQFATVTERCLFFMIGEQGFNNNADNYWEGFEPIRQYLHGEREKAGWNNQAVADFFGFHPRMADHWFSKSQWSFIRREQYERLQQEADGRAFTKSYDEILGGYGEIKQGYDELKAEFYKTRAYFDNAWDNMTDVWDYQRVQGEERHGHATPKPVEMIERIMRSSLPAGGLCYEPFGGSGSTLIAAEKSDRRCNCMELKPVYVDVIVRRWQDFTGKTAILESTGETFAEVASR